MLSENKYSMGNGLVQGGGAFKLEPAVNDALAKGRLAARDKGDGQVLGETELSLSSVSAVKINVLKFEHIEVQVAQHLLDVTNDITMLFIAKLRDLAAGHSQRCVGVCKDR